MPGINYRAGTTVATIAGVLIEPFVQKSATYVITRDNRVIECTSGTFATTLPTAVGFPGQRYDVKNSGAGVITVDTTSAETIDGNPNVTLAAGARVSVMSNGANWIILSN